MVFNKKKDKKDDGPKTESNEEATTAPPAENGTSEETALATTGAGDENPLTKMLPMELVADEYKPGVMALLTEMNPVKRGFDEASVRDWQPAEVRVRQGLSRNVPENVQLGELYSSTGDKVEKPLKFTPLFISKSHIKFEPGGGAKIECSSLDTVTSRFGTKCADCPDLPFRNGEPTACNTVLNAIVMSDDVKMYLVRFAKTSYKSGAALTKMAQKTPLPWSKWFTLGVSDETNSNKAKYHILTVSGTGENVDSKLQVVCDRLNLVIEQQYAAAKEKESSKVADAQLATSQLEADGDVSDDDAVEPDFSTSV